MSSSSRRLCAVLGAGALLGLTAKAQADSWNLVPRIEVGGTYNDNDRLAQSSADKVQVYGPYVDAQLDASRVTQVSKIEIVPRVHSTYYPSDTADQSTDGPLVEYALKLRAIRAQIEGTPIKVITNTALSGIHDIVGFQSYVGNDPTIDVLHIVQQTQITNVQAADVDPKLLVVPDSASGEAPDVTSTGRR